MIFQEQLPQIRLKYLPSDRAYLGTLLKVKKNIYIYIYIYIYMSCRDFLFTKRGFIVFSSRSLEWNFYEPLTTFEFSFFQISLFTPF